MKNYSFTKKIVFLLILAINSLHLIGQVSLLIEGSNTVNSSPVNWSGVNIPRSVPTLFTYRNNAITSINKQGYLLQAGDESPGSTNNNLNGQIVTGNKLIWNGPIADSIITHGLFVGYNINALVKYNYLDKVPYGIIFKSGTDAGKNMQFTSGGCAYNICKNGKFAVRMKGINGVKIYNNTFYNADSSGKWLILITQNSDRVIPSPSTGTKIFNNIFYSTTRFPMIRIEKGCREGFECDYNVYWCSANSGGEPIFNVDGVTKTWAEWRALGFDAHSILIDPKFTNTTDLTPTTRLNFGINLGVEWQTGLSTSATWVVGKAPATTDQNGTWQVGARVYKAVNPVNSINVKGLSNITVDDGTLQLTAEIMPTNADNQSIAWNIENITGKASISQTGLVKAIENGTVSATATATDGSGVSGTMVIILSNQSSLSSDTNKSETGNDSLPTFVSSNEIKIILNGDFMAYNACLYSQLGASLSRKIVDSDNVVFDISRLSRGIYFVVLSKGITSKVIKVMKP